MFRADLPHDSSSSLDQSSTLIRRLIGNRCQDARRALVELMILDRRPLKLLRQGDQFAFDAGYLANVVYAPASPTEDFVVHLNSSERTGVRLLVNRNTLVHVLATDARQTVAES